MKHKLLLWFLLLLALLACVPVCAQSVSSQQAHQALNTVLERREFGSLQQPIAPQGWWADFSKETSKKWTDFWKSFGEWFSRFGNWLSNLFPKSSGKENGFFNWWENAIPAMRTTLLAILYLLAAALLGFIGYRIYIWSQTRKVISELRGSGESITGERPTPLPTDWEYALRQIEEMWNKGDQRGALRLLLRASMAILDIRGIMQYDDSRANGEVLRELRRRGRQDLSELLRKVVRPCDLVWYGGYSIERSEFHNAVTAGKQLRELLLTDRLL